MIPIRFLSGILPQKEIAGKAYRYNVDPDHTAVVVKVKVGLQSSSTRMYSTD